MEFTYQVQDQSGQIFEGTIDAPHENNAVELLHGKGYIVLSLRAVERTLLDSDIGAFLSRPGVKDIVIFTRQLATLVDADMPLAESLRTLARQAEKAGFRKIIGTIADAVEGGSALSAALAEHPRLFGQFYVKLVRSGELSGKLHDSLAYLADYLERSQAINSKIRGALAYPAFVIIAMIVVAFIMVLYVLPQLLVILKESGVTDLPLSTKALIFLTDFVNAYFVLILVVLVAAGVLLWRYIRTERGKVWLDTMKLKLPVLGKILKQLYLARVAESLATLMKAGISILDAIKVTSDLVDNRIYQGILLEAEEEVRGGGSISRAFEPHAQVPALLTSMIAIGERTGKLDFMLEHVSKFYRTESENSIQNISQLIEPILMLILGLGVAILVSSILLPIYSLVGAS